MLDYTTCFVCLFVFVCSCLFVCFCLFLFVLFVVIKTNKTVKSAEDNLLMNFFERI